MNKLSLALLLTCPAVLNCMETEPTSQRKNPLQQLRERQHRQGDGPVVMQEVTATRGLQTKGGFVTIDFEEVAQENGNLPVLDLRTSARDTPAISLEQWKKDLEDAIKHGKSSELIKLLSEEGQPATRGKFFVPYQNALEQIKAHKDRELRILTNTPFKGSWCCYNGTYMWDRYVAPATIMVARGAIIAFSIWGIYDSAKKSLQEKPDDHLAAVTEAAPSIGSLAFAILGLPFDFINAYHRRILKKQQSKFEYYTIAEHSITTQDKIQSIVEENNQLLHEQEYTPASTLHRALRAVPEGDNDSHHSSSVDLEKELDENAGVLLEEK